MALTTALITLVAAILSDRSSAKPPTAAEALRAWRKHVNQQVERHFGRGEGLNQRYMALLLGIAPSAYKQFETGKSRPNPELALHLHLVTGIPIQTLQEPQQLPISRVQFRCAMDPYFTHIVAEAVPAIAEHWDQVHLPISSKSLLDLAAGVDVLRWSSDPVDWPPDLTAAAVPSSKWLRSTAERARAGEDTSGDVDARDFNNWVDAVYRLGGFYG